MEVSWVLSANRWVEVTAFREKTRLPDNGRYKLSLLPYFLQRTSLIWLAINNILVPKEGFSSVLYAKEGLYVQITKAVSYDQIFQRICKEKPTRSETPPTLRDFAESHFLVCPLAKRRFLLADNKRLLSASRNLLLASGQTRKWLSAKSRSVGGVSDRVGFSLQILWKIWS